MQSCNKGILLGDVAGNEKMIRVVIRSSGLRMTAGFSSFRNAVLGREYMARCGVRNNFVFLAQSW
jgi:hypothetical protein